MCVIRNLHNFPTLETAQDFQVLTGFIAYIGGLHDPASALFHFTMTVSDFN